MCTITRDKRVSPEKIQAMECKTIEINTKGKWVKVPAMEVNGHTIIVRGTCPKLAVIHDEEWLSSELDNAEQCVETLKTHRSNGPQADIFTFRQKIPGSLPKYKFFTEWESVAAARTTNFEEWWEKLPQETRKNVRRSQKRGVQVRVSGFDEALVQGIREVNDDSPVRQNARNKHFGKSIEQVKKDYSAFLDRSDFICAYHGSELIGFLKVVYKGEVASVLNLTTKATQADKRPANALVAKAIELCQAKGVSCLTFGLFNYGNKRESPLREFKSRNGFEEVLTPRFYVPLTRRGMLSLQLKLHRGLIGILPHRVISLGVGARAQLYNFTKFLSRCSSMLERPNRTRQTERSNPPAGSRL